MLMFDCGGGKEMLIYANILESETFNRLRNKNQRSTELTGFAIHSFFIRTKCLRILRLRISEI